MAIPKIADYPMPQKAGFPANKTNWQPDPARAVLLIHDMQRYFLRFYDANGPLMGDLIGNLVRQAPVNINFAFLRTLKQIDRMVRRS